MDRHGQADQRPPTLPLTQAEVNEEIWGPAALQPFFQGLERLWVLFSTMRGIAGQQTDHVSLFTSLWPRPTKQSSR